MKEIKLWNKVPGMCEETPVLEYYPAENKTSEATVVILPGGGYQVRAVYEGKDYAEYFNSLGMDAFVCEYRVSPHRHPLPLLDARRAIQVVRSLADELGFDKDKVGIMGSSAGGHLAASVCTLSDDYSDFIDEKDPIDEINFYPDFQVLCYPVIALNDFGHTGSGDNLLGHTDLYNPMRYRLSCQNNINEKTPKAFIWHTMEDNCVPVQNSLTYISELRKHNIDAEFHMFPFGPHGLGLSDSNPHVAQWTILLKNWLKLNELI